jgi:3-phenylpropionate/trans-cinnamate dioxygenase ferredoxin reductase subunit
MYDLEVLIVGSGHGGAHAAEALRRRGFAGSIGLMSTEDEPPYQRPPLSKSYLSGHLDRHRLHLRPAAFWPAQNVQLLKGHVIAVDSDAHTVQTAEGQSVGYNRLVWATGSQARTLTGPGHWLVGVHSLRSLADADAIAAELPGADHVVVVGGGYIGLEAAAALTAPGRHITLIEPMTHVLQRSSAEPVSMYLQSRQEQRGVDVRLGVTVNALIGSCATGRVSFAALSDGTRVRAQLVIVGIGATPLVDPLRAAGARGSDGIDVDHHGCTSLAGIYAIGDCAAQVNPYSDGRRVRIESVQNAVDQAEAVAAALTGQPAPASTLPTFWSDQGDVKLRTVGLSHGYDNYILRGDPAVGAFSVIYLRDDRVIGVDSVNAMRDHVQSRGLVATGAKASPQLADPDIPLSGLVVSDARPTRSA